MKSNYRAINATRVKLLANQEAARINEEARLANQLQAQGLSRTEALRAAYQMLSGK